MRIVLASASPRRLALLRSVGIEPLVMSADVDETARPSESPVELAIRLASSKAGVIARRIGAIAALVVGADTVVVVDGEVLGKPLAVAENATMLRKLRGRSHLVVTGVAVVRAQDSHPCSDAASTTVTFADIGDREVLWYAAMKEGLDKAGGYGVQGLAGAWVTAIHGSYSNVVGLPLDLLHRLIAEQGVEWLELVGANTFVPLE